MSAHGECTSVFHFADACLSIEHNDGVQHLLPEAVLAHSKLLRDVFESDDMGSAPVRLSAEQVQDWLSFITGVDEMAPIHHSVQRDATLINILYVRPFLLLGMGATLWRSPFTADEPAVTLPLVLLPTYQLRTGQKTAKNIKRVTKEHSQVCTWRNGTITSIFSATIHGFQNHC
jgi:hypothetical protein